MKDPVNKVFTYKAGRSIKDVPIPDLILIAKTEPPPAEVFTLDQVRELYRTEAHQIVEALHTCLPGGLIDALLVEMMAKHVSLFRVRHEEPKPKNKLHIYDAKDNRLKMYFCGGLNIIGFDDTDKQRLKSPKEVTNGIGSDSGQSEKPGP